MPVARIDEVGTDIYYEDSGAPDGVERYTTLVFVHGFLYNSGTFRRMFPYASRYGLRIITMNLRDYRGSSPYTPEEHALMTSPDVNDQAAAVRQHGREAADFLIYVCNTKGIPPVSVSEGGRKVGGIGLVTWSLGSITTISILGDPSTLDEGRRQILTGYMRKAILYDPPSVIYGVDPDIGLKYAFIDPDIPLEKKTQEFARWAASDYSAVPAEAWPITAEIVQQRSVNFDYAPAMHDLPPEEFNRHVEPAIASRPGNILLVPFGIHRLNARRAFMGEDQVLPDVEVLALWCDRSVYISVWGAKVLDELVQEGVREGKHVRSVSISRIPGANHFYHWDEPEEMVRLLSENV